MEGTVLTESRDARSRPASCPDIHVSSPGADGVHHADRTLISSTNISRNAVHGSDRARQRQIDAAQQRESRMAIARRHPARPARPSRGQTTGAVSPSTRIGVHGAC
jgi:hypothetical protein